jgi:hypothetical protein
MMQPIMIAAMTADAIGRLKASPRILIPKIPAVENAILPSAFASQDPRLLQHNRHKADIG